MDRNEARIRIDELRETLRENSRRYYVENAPTMSDYEYDHLMYELEDLEKQFPEFITPDSPTRIVGSDLEDSSTSGKALTGHRKEFEQYPHKYPMLSLGNTYSMGEVLEFTSRAAKVLGNKEFSYSCELKFDGTAICLTYRNGRLLKALTRGDGVVGDDVTENAMRISNIPVTLKGSGYPEEFEIRGEVLMPYKEFDRLNQERIDEEEPPFANPRNAASGSLKLLDPEEVGRRGLWCTLYHIPSPDISFRTHDEAMRAAASWGLPISDKRQICGSAEEIENYINRWDKERKFLPYATDGIVIKINELEYQTELGYTSKFPRWAVAYKFQAERALTKLESIVYQVGRTGAVTPVANLAPVQLSGTVVKRATLNNAGMMEQMDIRTGDSVYVEKGGEIIPKITGVELSERPAGSVRPVFPEICPDCGTPLVKEDGGAKYFCPNQDGCPMQIKGRLLHFLSRKAMNVIAGEATVEQLFNLDMVRTPADFYDLKRNDLLRLEGWKERMADRFLSSLRDSRKTGFDRVLFALGIRYVGETTAKSAAKYFGNIDRISSATMEELLAVPDIGEVIAESIYNYFRKPEHVVEIQRLRAAGLKMSMDAPEENLSEALKGLSIVISGNFSISRDEMKELITLHGGRNSSSISSRTSYLLAGTKPGPEKMKKAEQLGIKVISEDEFRKMLPEGSLPENREEEEEYTDLFGGLI